MMTSIGVVQSTSANHEDIGLPQINLAHTTQNHGHQNYNYTVSNTDW